MRTVWQECLDRLIFFVKSSLRQAMGEFIRHYDNERDHQGQENKIIHPEFAKFPVVSEVLCRKRLGGLLLHYYRDAA